MIKVVCLFKKRKGMTTEQFRTYYETTHRQIGLKLLDGLAERYVRRYLRARDPDSASELDYDVITEIWFRNEEDYRKSGEVLKDPEFRALVIDDENQLFDRPSMRIFLVEEERMDQLS